MPFPLDEITKEFVGRHFRKKMTWKEDWFLSILDASDKKYDVYWSVLALRDCGTSHSIPLLKRMLAFPMKDVKSCSILTIAHLARASESVFYGETLLDPKYREKAYAMWAISDAADERAGDYVLQYFQDNRAKLRSGRLNNGTIVEAVKYLHRVRDVYPKAEVALSEFRLLWQQLMEGERTEIMKCIPDFVSTP